MLNYIDADGRITNEKVRRKIADAIGGPIIFMVQQSGKACIILSVTRLQRRCASYGETRKREA